MENQTVLKKYLVRKKNLLISSAFFATISTLMQFVPFCCIYKIIELLMLGDYTAQSLMYWGMLSILSLIVSLIFLYASSMCSHIAAFNIFIRNSYGFIGAPH